MAVYYHKLGADVFGNQKYPSKPHKRPMQDRSRFTVDAVYGALVRILDSADWSHVSMRRLSEESGYAVGTLYEYFPDKHAVLSGYIRHAIESRLALMSDIINTSRSARVKRAIQIMIGIDAQVPTLFPDLFELEAQIASAKHHERVFREFVDAWTGVLNKEAGLMVVSPSNIEMIVLISWGSWRYNALLGMIVMNDQALAEHLSFHITNFLEGLEREQIIDGK